MNQSSPALNNALVAMLNRAKKDFLSLTDILAQLPADVMADLGLSRQSSTNAVATALSSRLEPGLTLHRKGQGRYIGRPLIDILTGILKRKPGKSPKQIIAMKLPVNKETVLAALNEAMKTGTVQCSFNAYYTPALCLAKTLPAASLTADRASDSGLEPAFPLIAPQDDAADRRAFKAAYDTVGKGRSYVPIYRLRRHLGWPRERFDQVIARLSQDLIVQLQGGDPSSMTQKDIEDSYLDDQGRLRISVTWRELS